MGPPPLPPEANQISTVYCVRSFAGGDDDRMMQVMNNKNKTVWKNCNGPKKKKKWHSWTRPTWDLPYLAGSRALLFAFSFWMVPLSSAPCHRCRSKSPEGGALWARSRATQGCGRWKREVGWHCDATIWIDFERTSTSAQVPPPGPLPLCSRGRRQGVSDLPVVGCSPC